jgi:hypothetical protein
MQIASRISILVKVSAVALAFTAEVSRAQQSTGAQTEPCLTPRLINPHDTDPAIGPGALAEHHVWIDPCVRTNHKLLVFMAGTGLNPADYLFVQQEAARSGYHVIGLTYPNTVRLAISCASPDPAAADACFESARLEILDGNDRTTVVDVNPPNSIDNRLTKLLLYLSASFPEEGWGHFLWHDAPRWSRIAVSGHSQGGGEAAMIAKLRVTARVVMFSSVPDTDVAVGHGSPVPPTWESSHATPSRRYWGLAHDRDPAYGAITAGWGVLGMTGFGPLVPPEAGAPPYGFTHTLATDLLPRTGSYLPMAPHNSTAVDAFTPLGLDGTPALADAWRYLLTAERRDEDHDGGDDGGD